jgi:hypothetical protein
MDGLARSTGALTLTALTARHDAVADVAKRIEELATRAATLTPAAQSLAAAQSSKARGTPQTH